MNKTEPKVIFENADLIVVDKPAGLMVHAARVSARRHADAERAAEPTLVDWLLPRYPEIKGVGDDPSLRPGIVHRLDKATSGVMVVARTQAAFEWLKRSFQEHRIRKTYLAVVEGVPKNKSGMIDAPIGIKSGSLKRSVRSPKMAKLAVTEYSIVREMPAGKDGGPAHALLRVTPKTGRTHQIRVHLASIGHPIVGDPLYGKKVRRVGTRHGTGPAARLMLHAAALAFEGPDGGRFEFEAPVPPDFSAQLSTGVSSPDTI